MYSDGPYSDTMSWSVAAEDFTGAGGSLEFTDDGTSTAGHPSSIAERYYKVRERDTGRESANIVGMYALHINVGRNLISSPVVPLNGELDVSIGNQLSGTEGSRSLADRIERWNKAAGAYEMAYFSLTEDCWKDWATGGVPVFGIGPDEGYWIVVPPFGKGKDIVLVGEVSQSDRRTALGFGENLVGTTVPFEISLDDSGLTDSGFTGNADRDLSDLVQWWNSDTNQYETVYYNPNSSEWMNWDGTAATRTFLPGDGVWITIRDFNGEFDWRLSSQYK
jgi:hypothetical protein